MTMSRVYGEPYLRMVTCLPERKDCVFMKWHDRLPPKRLSKTFLWNQDGYRVFLRLLKWPSIRLKQKQLGCIHTRSGAVVKTQLFQSFCKKAHLRFRRTAQSRWEKMQIFAIYPQLFGSPRSQSLPFTILDDITQWIPIGPPYGLC